MWRNLPLGNLAEITSGGTPSRDVAEYWGGDIPWVTPTDITACRTNYLFDTADQITKRGLLNSSAKVLPVGTILFTSRATVGISKIAGVPVCTNQGFKCLSPLHNVDGKFLFYQVQRLKGAFERYAAGSTFLEINKKDTARVLIPHPVDPNAQQKIAAILTSIDTAIEKTEALIEKYQQIKAGLMHDLFTRGVLPNGQLRPPREQAPELYQQTAIGWIPKEWELVPLGKIASLQRGHDIVGAQFREGAYPVISSSGVIGFHSEATTKSPNVVVGRKGTIGKVHFLEQDFWAHDTSLFVTNFNNNFEKFVFHLCVHLDLARFGTRSGSPSLNRNDIHPILVARPTRKEQITIAKLVDKAELHICSNRNQLIKLKYQKLGLMQDLLTGKVPVKVDDPAADSVNA